MIASKQLVSHFKIRCVGLLEILLKTQGENPLIVDIVSRIIKLVLKTAPANGVANGQMELHQKLLSVANKIGRSKSVPEQVDQESVCNILQDLHETVGKYGSSATLVGTCSQASLFITKIALSSTAASTPIKKKKSKKSVVSLEVIEKLVCEIYQASLTNLLSQKRTKFTAKFLADFATRFPALAFQHLATPLCKLIDLEQVSGPFQLVEGMRVLKGVLTSISAEVVLENKSAVDALKIEIVGMTAKVVRQLVVKKDRKRIKECLNEFWEIIKCKRVQPAADCASVVEELEKLEGLEVSSSIAKMKKRLAALQ
jgi:hypothetical protein